MPPEYYHKWSLEWEDSLEVKAIMAKMIKDKATPNEVIRLHKLRRARVARMLDRATIWCRKQQRTRYRPDS